MCWGDFCGHCPVKHRSNNSELLYIWHPLRLRHCRYSYNVSGKFCSNTTVLENDISCRTDTPPGDQKVANANSFVHHPAFPSLPVTVPLTFTLTMKACLSETPSERPTFGQIATIFEDVLFEVDTGTYINSNGHVMVRYTLLHVTVRALIIGFLYRACWD